MHKHILLGCRLKPLASYLKALGILRLISEQKDSQAKGWWQEETFIIKTSLNKEALETFFNEEYVPTPIVAPWNGGSGFYLGDSVEGLEAITTSDQGRFAEYQDIISQIRSWPEIPRFDTVEDVLSMLNNTLETMKPSKKKEELEKLLNRIEDNIPPAEHFEIKDIRQINLSHVESLSKERDNLNRDALKNWWNLIKKGRTKCNTIKRNENKNTIMPKCRARLPESSLKWLDAVYTLQSDGKASYNPVLGTGGNEGRLDFSNNFMQRLAELFINGDPDKTKKLFSSAAFNTTLAG